MLNNIARANMVPNYFESTYFQKMTIQHITVDCYTGSVNWVILNDIEGFEPPAAIFCYFIKNFEVL